MTAITKLVVPASIGPAEVEAGRAYVHDAELEGDEALTIGMRVEVLDDAGRYFAATERFAFVRTPILGSSGETLETTEFTVQERHLTSAK